MLRISDLIIVVFVSALLSSLQGAFTVYPDIIVDGNGTGDYKSIQEALNSIPESSRERTIIRVNPGVYQEKLFIINDFITIEATNPDSTVIEFPVLRENWRMEHDDDWGAAVINIRASDLILRNLTVRNTYGDEFGVHSHQFAVRLMDGTRIIFDGCRFIAGGGDTVSLWNKKDGMFYHRNCYFEGHVDFVCPRGWCYIEGSKFYQAHRTAALWHDGSDDESQKLVIKNSHFDGVDGFRLGRRHYDAQFYLLDCTISEKMADHPIYRVTYPDAPERNRPNKYGDRYYYSNVNRSSSNYSWHEDNLTSHPAGISAADITSAWAFDDRWHPESASGPVPISTDIEENFVEIRFDELVTVKGKPQLVSETGTMAEYQSGSGSKIISFKLISGGQVNLSLEDVTISNGKILASSASLDWRTYGNYSE